MSFQHARICLLWSLAALLVLAGPARSEQDRLEVRGHVRLVRLAEKGQAELLMTVLEDAGPLKTGAEIAARASFELQDRGRIDWSKESNQALGPLLKLRPGDKVRALLIPEAEGWRLVEVAATAWTSRLSFPGREKLTDPSILDGLTSPEATVRVIVLLVDYDQLSQKAGAGDETARAEIRRLQDSLLADLSGAEFLLSQRFENLAALAGQANLAGINVLAGHRLVALIEPDRPLQPLAGERPKP